MPNVECFGHLRAGRVAVFVAASAMLGLVGCSSDKSGSAPQGQVAASVAQSSADPDAKTSTPDALCELLTPAELSTLTGEASDPKTLAVGGLPACHWKTPAGGRVQVIGTSAEKWATQLPAAIEQLKKSGLLDDPETARKLEAARDLIASGKEIAPDRACELFSTLLEIQGQPVGSSRTVNLIPTRENPKAINGQACSGGRFTSVQLVAPNLSGSDDEVSRLSSVLTSAHERNRG
ncbi:DUF3558 family protein [Amycolatopsis keratiniphila]|uniref:DUF3558 family protein n=1 Tax=Amycolatopsis keratiniphila TaxID=129921 RepID=UPI00087D6745|nr:DUF3558 family protein [Amycolatopsis keratiniphila]SDU38780.1 Protein of unknown function [Amycolatopsis keratiniphila]